MSKEFAGYFDDSCVCQDMYGDRRGRPTLRQLCLRQLASQADTGGVSLVGVPPHLVRQVLAEVKTPDELERIAENPENANIPCMEEELDERWHKLFMKNFWVGKSKPPELPPKANWHQYYRAYERNKKEERDHIIEKTQKKSEKKEKKKSNVIDAKHIPRESLSSRNYVAARSTQNTAAPGTLAHDFLRRFPKFR